MDALDAQGTAMIFETCENVMESFALIEMTTAGVCLVVLGVGLFLGFGIARVLGHG